MLKKTGSMSSKVTIILDPEKYAHYLRFVVRCGDFCIGWFYLNPSGFSPVMTLRTMGKCTTLIHKNHYSGVIMGTGVSEITSLTVVYSTVYPTADQRKHQSNASLAFVRWIHRGAVNSPHKWPVTRKMFLFDDVIMMMIRSQRNKAPQNPFALPWFRWFSIVILQPYPWGLRHLLFDDPRVRGRG